MKYKFIILSFLLSSIVFSQKKELKGIITDSINNPIIGATVLLKDTEDNFINYSLTDENGNYLIEINNATNKYILEISFLGFKTEKETILIDKSTFIKNYSLVEDFVALKEVLVEEHQKVTIQQDTTFIKVKSFSNNTEQTVEDILKKLPGITVQKDGTIKAHGKTIDKLLVEGEDIFNQNYKILSRNLDANTLEEVQILDNFEDNPILKSLSNSNKVAINLKLKKGLENVWFGNINAGYGTEKRFKENVNIGLLRKKIKGFYFLDYSNLGSNTSDLLDGNFGQMDFSMNEKIELKSNKVLNTNLFENSFFQTSQINFNKGLLNSLSFTSKISNKTIIRTSINYFNDSQLQNQNQILNYTLPNETIENSEQSSFNKDYKNSFGEIEVKYLSSDNSYFTNYLKFNFSPTELKNSVTFNTNENIENINQTDNFIVNHLENTYKIGFNKLLQNYIYIGLNSLNEKNKVFSEKLNEYFIVDSNKTIIQRVKNNLFYSGIKSSYLYKKTIFESSSTIQFHFEEEISNSKINTLENESLQSNIAEFNKTIISFNQVTKIKLLKNLKFNSVLNLNFTNLNSSNFFLYSFQNNLHYKTPKKGSFNLSYIINKKLPENYLINQQNNLIDYRSFNKGSKNIEAITSNTLLLNYHLDLDKRNFSIDINTELKRTNKLYSYKTTINNDLLFNENIILGKYNSYNLSFILTKYIKPINLVSKIENYNNWSTVPLQLSNESPINYKNYSSSFKISNSTIFEKFPNFDFGFSYMLNKSSFQNTSNKNNFKEYFINLNYDEIKNFVFEIKNSLYVINNEKYHFLNLIASFNPNNSNLTLKVIANNLNDENVFIIQTVDNFTFYQKTINLVPKYYLLSLKYQF